MTVAAGQLQPAYIPRADTIDQRLYPPRYNSRYAVATLLRRTIEQVTRDHIAKAAAPRLLDFGCGDMPYRSIVEPHVARYEGIDLPGNQRATFTLNADGTTAAPADYADVVLSTQVLEHVADPVKYLAESRRMLKPGGLLVLSTHGYWLHHPDPTDYWRWTGDGLKKLVSDAGFTVLELRGTLGLLPAGLQLAHDGLVRRILPKPIRPYVGPVISLLLQTPLLWLDRLHTDRQRANDAAVFVIVARKQQDPS